ncbi:MULTISPECIES: universal stress protein [Halorussus]|uniref:universal stress protein n=1 Tax=Halorussus TaxID=1070314 RepID=UPI00209EFD60|nr:universal stress protein [Halorussus vallis]USZ76472.1 universal stress protein [Halorussus vallis]
MTRVVVPVRYPLSAHSRRTLEEAIGVAEERDAELTVLHVNLYHKGKTVSRAELKRAVEEEFGPLPHTRYVIREGFLVEETILEEVAAEHADVVVIGHKQSGRWRRMLRKLTSDPNVDSYLREKLDAEVITVGK